MIELPNQSTTHYFLPEDGEIARAKFLEILAKPTETWISAYGMTMASAFDTLQNIASNGVQLHLLLDYTQSKNKSAMPRIKELKKNLTFGDITLTTAGVNSKRSSTIWHHKAFVKLADDGGEPWCWFGSVNFSEDGWFQGNTACLFRSQEWADIFVQQNKDHELWARKNLPHYQLMVFDTDPIDYYFANYV